MNWSYMMKVLRKSKIKKPWLIALIPAILTVVVGVFAVVLVVALLLIKVLWAWTIPDLFPGAVAQGLVARDIGWLTSFKLALLLAVITSIVAGMRGTGENE